MLLQKRFIHRFNQHVETKVPFVERNCRVSNACCGNAGLQKKTTRKKLRKKRGVLDGVIEHDLRETKQLLTGNKFIKFYGEARFLTERIEAPAPFQPHCHVVEGLAIHLHRCGYISAICPFEVRHLARLHRDDKAMNAAISEELTACVRPKGGLSCAEGGCSDTQAKQKTCGPLHTSARASWSRLC